MDRAFPQGHASRIGSANIGTAKLVFDHVGSR
jgi:hypothetical protein